MPTELTTIWILNNVAHVPGELNIEDIASMLDDGWELVSWQPMIAPARVLSNNPSDFSTSASSFFDVFLLRKNS